MGLLAQRQVVFSIYKIPQIFFINKRRLLVDLCHSALRALTRYFEVVAGAWAGNHRGHPEVWR